MWTEKYRPNTLDDVIGQEHIVKRLEFMVDRVHQTGSAGDFPHLLLAGHAGLGKTSVAYALMRSMFGESWESNFIELNASDERSISVIRSKVKDFSSRGVIGNYEVDGRTIGIPFNVVFLDEADNLTPDAQSALRRIMERYAKQTRFILSCNYPHKLIDPIRDRCAFADTRFQPIRKKPLLSALQAIVDAEGLHVEQDALEAVGRLSGGSMRKALNLLFLSTRIPGKVEVEDVREVANQIAPEKVRQLLASAIEASRLSPEDEKWLRTHRRLDTMIEKLGQRGLSGVEILDAFHRTVQEDDNVPLNLRRSIYKHIGEAVYWCSISQDDLLTAKTFLRRITV